METHQVNAPDFANKVAALCYNKYASLPKKGKPQTNKEWTLLAAVVATRHDGEMVSEVGYMNPSILLLRPRIRQLQAHGGHFLGHWNKMFE
jgi:hypothetical protein